MRRTGGRGCVKAPAIYNHFDSKAWVLSTAVDYALSDFLASVLTGRGFPNKNGSLASCCVGTRATRPTTSPLRARRTNWWTQISCDAYFRPPAMTGTSCAGRISGDRS